MATSNKEYGSHYGRAQSSKKESIGKTTLGFLIKNDVGNYLHQQENVAQRSRHGLFTQPMGLANGDQYHDIKRIFEAIQLSQFLKMLQLIIDWCRKLVRNSSRRWDPPILETFIRINSDKTSSTWRKRQILRFIKMLLWQAESKD